jgi:hypothetical protein
VRSRILVYSPTDQSLGLRLATAVSARVPDGVCLLVRRGEGDAPDPGSRVAVLDLPPVLTVGRKDIGLRVLADVAREMRPDAIVVLGEPLGERGELAPALAVLRAAGRPAARFLALSEAELAQLSSRANGRALRALLAWYDHALVFGDLDECAEVAPDALRAPEAIGVSYVGADPDSGPIERAVAALVGDGPQVKVI